MPHLYILSGASGCGKTTLLNSIASHDEINIDEEIRAVRAPKFSERATRKNNGDLDDIISVPEIRLGEYDIAYVINNVKYGIKIKPISDLLEKGLNPFIIISDFRVVRELKNQFKSQAKALYISSAIDSERLRRIQRERLGFSPTEEQKYVLAYHFARTRAAARLNWWDRVSDCMEELEKDWRAYATDSRSTEIRAQKIRAFHIRYIEHIPMFDHVILNYSENNPKEMTLQVKSLIQNLDNVEQYKRKKHPPLFVVAAASGAGKGTLMEMLNLIGRDKVRITSKLAKRAPKEEDKRDGMIAIQRSSSDPTPEIPDWWSKEMAEKAFHGEFPDSYDLQWEFHKQHDTSSKGTKYAVSTAEIQRNIDENKPQILVSNMEQFQIFRKLWSKNVVFIYLHRLMSEHENREFQMNKWKKNRLEAETRIAEKKYVHLSYMQNIANFDHVLLNTNFQEDLYDQMFRILEYYKT